MGPMSEVVPLPSFGGVFFDARGQERCLRVAWHEGALGLRLWRGEMCTGSFRMPTNDVGRLLDTLEDGYAEVSGEIPIPEPEPIPAEYPGTGQYHRPPPIDPEPMARPQYDDRPTAALSPNDVLVARGTPVQPDKLVASYSETPIGPGGVPDGRSQRRGGAAPGYRMPPQSTDPHGFPRQSAVAAYSGQALPDPFAPQPIEFHRPSEAYATSPQQPDPFAEPRRSGAFTPSIQQMFQSQTSAAQRPDPLSDPLSDPLTDPLGAPRLEPLAVSRPDPLSGQGQDPFAAPRPNPRTAPRASGTPGLGTPMHGIPGASRRGAPPVQEPPA